FSDPTFLIGLEHFLGNYSIPGGSQLVRESISRHLRRLFGVSLRWEELFLVNNELAALEVFVNTFYLILCPAPFAYPELAKNIKTQTQIEFWPIPLTTNGKQLEMDDLINTYQKIKGKGRRARALLLHNPHPILGSLQDGDRRIAKLVEWTSDSCLALDHNSLQSGKNIIWIWNGSKHFSLPGLEFSVIYYPHQSDIFLNSSIAHYQQCSPLIQFFASKLLDDFEWTSKLFEKRKFRLESLSSQMLNELKNINIYSNQILKTERPITQWILIDLFKYLSLINGNISFVSEKELYKEFKQIGNIELICGEELGMERPGWFRLRYLPNVIERLKNILENKLMTLNNQTEIVDINELGCKYGGGDENEEGLKEREEEMEEDEVLSKVFSIFPEEHWEKQSPQTLLISPNKTLEYSPLSVTVPDRPKINFFEKEENYNTTNILDDSNDSKRIIEIIDQIFRDAVQIKDFSSSSTESHPNNAIPQHDRHWSDSGLAAESPPDFSSLSPPPPNKQEKSSTVGIQLPFEELTPEYTRRRLIGPNDQMLDDSGIFVELQPGSLSIDFPLLVPVDKLNKVEEISESILPSKNISSTNLQLNKELINNDNIPIMTINLPFKSVEEEIVGWKPLENLKEENENKELLKPLINEKRKLSATDWYKPKSGEVLDWKPLEQINILIEEKKEQEINEEYLVNDNQDSNNIFKESRNEEDEKRILFSSNNSSKTQQIHHKMQMRRCRRRPLCGSKLNRNLLTIEHINITQLEYLGGDMLERIEKGERIVTNISTKLNNFAENELFNKLDFQKNERINKFVEIKRNRSEETGKIKTETKIIKRQNNEEIKEENASLYTEIISNNNSENPFKHTPGTNWCVSSIYKTTEYGWEKQTLKPRFATKFDEMPRRTST
uniref:Protein TIC 214 n=1 Tax=Meloidogyne javanica TaxID=6303 RepID=A0A915MUJ9_MELJA